MNYLLYLQLSWCALLLTLVRLKKLTVYLFGFCYSHAFLSYYELMRGDVTDFSK